MCPTLYKHPILSPESGPGRVLPLLYKCNYIERGKRKRIEEMSLLDTDSWSADKKPTRGILLISRRTRGIIGNYMVHVLHQLQNIIDSVSAWQWHISLILNPTHVLLHHRITPLDPLLAWKHHRSKSDYCIKGISVQSRRAKRNDALRNLQLNTTIRRLIPNQS